MKILKTEYCGKQYVKVVGSVREFLDHNHIGEKRTLVYYIRKPIWINMTGEQLQSDIQMMQHAEIVVDPNTNVFVKNRHTIVDMIDTLLKSDRW